MYLVVENPNSTLNYSSGMARTVRRVLKFTNSKILITITKAYVHITITHISFDKFTKKIISNGPLSKIQQRFHPLCALWMGFHAFILDGLPCKNQKMNSSLTHL